MRPQRYPETRQQLQIFPCCHGNPRLSEHSTQKILPDVASMGIWNADPQMLFDHELVFPARIWTSKTQLTQAANQLCPRCWANAWHQATSWIASVMPSMEGSG